jgi:hypothetical protein
MEIDDAVLVQYNEITEHDKLDEEVHKVGKPEMHPSKKSVGNMSDLDFGLIHERLLSIGDTNSALNLEQSRKRFVQNDQVECTVNKKWDANESLAVWSRGTMMTMR